jgi:dihydrodipicolinate synthase/N-acetylneuraminate lyase
MDRHKKALKKLAEGTVIPAHPLVLDENRVLDEKRQRALSRYYLAAGVGGLAVGVHTTQFEIRDPEVNLFEPVLKMAAEEIEKFEKENDKAIVKISGACGPMEQALRETKLAKKYGYDAVLLSPGGLDDLSEEEILERTEKVAEVLPVIGFYLQPSVGGRVFSYDYWSKFCEINNVVAIKSAPFNRYQTLEVVRAAALSSRADEIALYTGNDDNIVIDLLTEYRFEEGENVYKKGFDGGLLGHWAVWTQKAVEMFEELKEVKKRDSIPAKYLTLAAEVTDANSAFFDTANNFEGVIAGIHEVLRRQGIMEGIWCLDENETLSPGQKEEIDRVYRMYPHLSDDQFIEENLENWL